jgi:hypothetical protein
MTIHVILDAYRAFRGEKEYGRMRSNVISF